MVEITRIKSGSKFEERNSFSRAVRAGKWVFSSNSSGRNYETHEISASVTEQFEQALRNIERAFAGVGACLEQTVQVRVSFCNLADQAEILEIFGRSFRNIDPAITMICQPFAGTEVKVELELTAYLRDKDEDETVRL